MADRCYKCMNPVSDSSSPCPNCGFINSEYSPELHHLLPGTVVNSRYVIGSVIGEGGFGITYVGLDTVLDLKVAVKEFFMHGYVNRNSADGSVISIGTGNYAETFVKNKEKFINEARVLARFSGEAGIVGIRDYFSENGTSYMVMEFIDGQTLSDYLREKGTLSWESLYKVFLPVLSSLEAVHNAHIIHRDISPDNIMVTDRGTIKLLDFGAARVVTDGDPKSMSVILKHGYAPEEQYRSKGIQGPWTDVYALSATMYKALTGKVPDNALDRLIDDRVLPPNKINASCPETISSVIMTGMAVNKKDRFESVSAFHNALVNARNNVAPREKNSVNAAPQHANNDITEDKNAALHAGKDCLPASDPQKTILVSAPASNDKQKCTETLSQQKKSVLKSLSPTIMALYARNYTPVLMNMTAIGKSHILLMHESGTVTAKGENSEGQCMVSDWSGLVAVSAGDFHSVGLRADGTVLETGNGSNVRVHLKLLDWHNIIAVSAGGRHSLGINMQGQCFASGDNTYGQCNVRGWKVKAVSAGKYHSLGLKEDGTVAATVFRGSNYCGQCDVSMWRNIKAVAAGGFHSLGLRSDGTVVATQFRGKEQYYGQCDVEDWTDIVAIAAGTYHSLGLKKDGTVVSAGRNTEGQCDVSDWMDILAISAGGNASIGVCCDGCAVGTKASGIYSDNEKFRIFSDVKIFDNESARKEILLYSLRKQSEKFRTFFIENDLCSHCGGTFKGIFGKTCSVCGRPKDY